MLSANDIAQRIDQPDLVTPTDLEGLKELSQKYPYTQLFSILYLKGLGKQGGVLFEEELQQHSYRISDRVQLFHLINLQTDSTDETHVIEKESTEIEINIDTDNSPELAQEAQVELEGVEKITIEKTTEDTEENIATVKMPQEQTSDESNLGEIEAPNDALEENIIHHAVASGFQLEELNEKELEELEDRTLNISDPIEDELNEELQVPPIEVDMKQSFTSWLSSDVNHVEESNQDKAAIQAVVDDFEEFDPSEELYGEIEKPKKEFFSPIKKAKESLNEDALPVSQTLAKIYAIQGNYPKAIAAYEELSLKYPEKKIFFANLIKELKNKINT